MDTDGTVNRTGGDEVRLVLVPVEGEDLGRVSLEGY